MKMIKIIMVVLALFFSLSAQSNYSEYYKCLANAQTCEANRQYLNSITTLEEAIYKQRFMNINSTLIGKSYENIMYPAIKNINTNLNVSRKDTDTWSDLMFFVALLHTGQVMIQLDSVKFTNYKQCLWDMVLNGNLHAAQYAVIMDAIYDQSMYGMQVEENLFGKITKYAPVQYPEKVDSLRANIYLSPLCVQSTLTGYKTPKGYKKTKK